MKKLSLIVLFLAFGSLTLAGCSATQSQCGCFESNCCSWDFYQKCDLIEGRAKSCCDPCGKGCRPGVVVSRCFAEPVDAAPAEGDAAPAEGDAAPADGAPVEGAPEEPVAEFGLPPAGR